jgi:hypothetical protein
MESGYSRIVGGIHYGFTNESGQFLGRLIGDQVSRNFLTAVPEPGTLSLVVVGGLALLGRRRA